jgi:hypothetical protein
MNDAILRRQKIEQRALAAREFPRIVCASIAVQISVLLLILMFFVTPTEAVDYWSIFVAPSLSSEPAIMAAIEDIKLEGDKYHIKFEPVVEPPKTLKGVILVGSPALNPSVSLLAEQGEYQLNLPESPRGYQIRTLTNPSGDRTIVVASESVLGHVNGLYWLWDRLRVFRRIPTIDCRREPFGPICLTAGRNEKDIRNALRFGATWVSSGNILDLVPWDEEPEASQNQKHRQQLKKLIDLAHMFHLKYLAVGDEMSFHPEFLEKMQASLDPADPQIWLALQEKYRRLFQALPELDGVQIRSGELTRVGGDYLAFDVMHKPESSDWTLDRRYCMFLRKLHEVVVEEFGKIYFHRSWSPSATEQHSDAKVYQKIFTDEIPTDGLYLSPYMSQADRWYYQPYNPTFNLTPHRMLVLFSTLDYHAHAGVNVFPSFPGKYHQGGLQRVLAAQESNLAGMHFAAPNPQEWSTQALTGYTVYRLMWNPNEELHAIAKDYAAIHLGPKAAAGMAEILLLSYQSYKDGIYIKSVAEKIRGNTLPHLRLTSFVRKGVPEIDHGRGHLDWLRRSMIEPSIGQQADALAHLNQGLKATREMRDRYRQLVDEVENQELANKIADSLELTFGLVETNNAYVKNCYDYFAYRDQPNDETKKELAKSLRQLKASVRRFRAAPDFCYDLTGVEQIMVNSQEALEDLSVAEQTLVEAPATADLETTIADWTQKNTEGLEQRRGIAKRFFRWRARVDGRDIVHVQADRATIEHIEADAIGTVDQEFFQPLPAQGVTVFVKDIKSLESAPFILEQPTADNDYTAKIYLFDSLPGYQDWEFELYYTNEDPFENDLAPPWQKRSASSR